MNYKKKIKNNFNDHKISASQNIKEDVKNRLDKIYARFSELPYFNI